MWRFSVTLALAGVCGAADLQLVGSARLLEDRLRLTRSFPHEVGAAWVRERQFVREGFEARFQFQMTSPGGLGPGADGFAFVLQNSGPEAIGNRGSAGGFGLGEQNRYPDNHGIPRSLAVFFDTFQNQDDPSDNYIAICANGAVGRMRWPPPRLGMAKRLRFRLKDGRAHAARVSYKPPVMRVYLDDAETPALTARVDLSAVLDSSGRAFAGFTASTGNGYENHDILNWTLIPDTSSVITSVDSSIQFLEKVTCMEGRNLCTPKEAVVEAKGDGAWHILLPAHIPWAASVPNSAGRPIRAENIQGNVCRNVKTRGAEGCGGPGAAAIAIRSGRGRTWFSVAGAAPDNEGFFEFDAVTK
ncbi:MAG TPA: L-type lectin-domain containing protein [Bryobacteraceae bacterium]|nr:L-type lectin-domain containing protein [Bryobacteraceae bacterium]